MRAWIKRLERVARREMIAIPQQDGTVARFPPDEAKEAFLAIYEGRDHPLARAARSSSAPEWRDSFYSLEPLDQDAEDLSEP